MAPAKAAGKLTWQWSSSTVRKPRRLGYLQAHSERTPRPLMCALLHERSPALMRRVLHAGADELMFLLA